MSINAVYEDSQGNVHESRMDGVDLTTKISIADDFSASVNYAVGDFCYHLGTLYKCTTAHTAGAWNAAHFTATQVGDEIGELKNTITKHSFGSGSKIITLTKNVDYVCETDGYFYIYSGSNTQKTYAYGYINGYPLMASSTPMSTSLEGYPYSSLFCRKGTVIKFAGSSDAIGLFYKLI